MSRSAPVGGVGIILMFLSLLVPGCTSREPTTLCSPGATQSCACAAGGQGTQTCTPDGSAWGACGGCAATVDAGQDAAPDTTVPDMAPDAPPCGAGLTLCGARCVDLKNDNNNCGACGTRCLAGQRCAAGLCEVTCQSGLTNCNGKCVNLKSDNTNCGACGSTCNQGEV